MSTVWIAMICPTCRHEDQADMDMLIKGMTPHCSECDTLMEPLENEGDEDDDDHEHDRGYN